MAALEEFSAGERFDSVVMDRDRFVAFSFCTADLLIELDAEKKITFAAGATRALLERSPEELVGKKMSSLIAAVDRIMGDETLNKMRDYGALEETLVRLRMAKGPTEKLAMSGYFLDELGGRFYLAFRRKVTKAIIVRENDVVRDDESGLLQAASFVDLASEKLEELGDQYQMTTLELSEGDALRSRLDKNKRRELQAAIGSTLRANSAGGDLAGDLGDDKFALIHHRDMDVTKLEERLVDQTKRVDPTGVGAVVHAARVATEQGGGISSEEATKALILAVKSLDAHEGGLDIEALSQNLTSMVADTTRQMTEVRSVIADGQFTTVFQPVVRLRDAGPHHFEALTRFDKTDLSVSPFKFIRLAEDVGLVAEFDLATCKRALEHLVGEKRTLSALPIAVNLSGRSLNSDEFTDSLSKLLGEFESVRRKLLIEITETVRLKDFGKARNYVESLRERGHKVCLDDFGAGEAQIDYLKELNVDFVKIDGSYIQAAQKDPTNKVLLKAITGMCREMKVATIAEMIEDEKMVPFLKDCGVLLGQGYLYGKPQPEPTLGENARAIDPGPSAAKAGEPGMKAIKGGANHPDYADAWSSVEGEPGAPADGPVLRSLSNPHMKAAPTMTPIGKPKDDKDKKTEMQW